MLEIASTPEIADELPEIAAIPEIAEKSISAVPRLLVSGVGFRV
jgi:hypothetical protein